MEIRPYDSADRPGCLALMDATAPDTRTDFEAYLESAPVFFVAEHDGEIVGCGGIELAGPAAELVWGMVHPTKRGMGLGRFLLMYRLREITKRGSFEFVHVNPPPSARAFYAGQGFRDTPGGTTMAKRLAVCS